MTIRDKQRKLQKLLALSASPNEIEANAAMEKCQKLMAGWGIRTIDVNEVTKEVGISTMCVEGYAKTHTTWESKLAAAISSIFDAEAIIQRRTDGWNIMFITTTSESLIVTDLYKRLRRIISKLSRKYSATHKGNRSMLEKSYAFGMINKVYTRLVRIYTNNVDERGLVIIKKEAINSKVGELFPHIKNARVQQPKDRMAYIQGEADGEKVDLNKSTQKHKQNTTLTN